MTREEAKQMLGESATDEQVSALLNKFHKEQTALQEEITGLKTQVTSLTTDNTNLKASKKELDELKKANMSEKELLEAEKKLLAEERRKTALERNTAKAKTILAGIGMDDASLDAMIKTFVNEDEATTVASATLFANSFKGVQENTAKKTKEDLASVNIKPTPTNIPQNSTTMTREKFFSLSQAEQNKFIEEHPDEFYKL
jgi:hypothetical protein